jgi:hypothetical protein
MLVSILIPTLLERLPTFNPMVQGLYKQIKDNKLEDKIEIITMCDNRTVPLSVKRNMMQKMAKGLYFTHLDDDDNFTDDYCVKVVEHIEEMKTFRKDIPDIIGYDQKCFVEDRTFILKPSVNHTMRMEEAPRNAPNPYDLPMYFRTPWQWCLWNRKRFGFVYRSDADTNAREDQNWLKKVHLEYPKSMSVIQDWIGHEYHFEDPSKSTCQ